MDDESANSRPDEISSSADMGCLQKQSPSFQGGEDVKRLTARHTMLNNEVIDHMAGGVLPAEQSAKSVQVVVDAALADKIWRLEYQADKLRLELREAREASVGVMLNALRGRQAILLYIGTEDGNQFVERLTKDFGSEIANQVIYELFVLDNCPMSASERQAIRTATNFGLDRR